MAQGYAKKDFADPGWQDYTPDWTGATTDPVIGNGTITGRYTQIGTTVHFRVSITMGSTTTYGSGAFFVSLPVTAALTDIDVGVASAQDTPVGLRYIGTLHTNDGTTAFVQNEGGTSSGSWRSDAPITWADTDELHLLGTYEAAESAFIELGLNNDHGSLSGLTDDDHSAYPKGVLGYAERETDYNNITTEITFSSTTVTADVAANRYIRISWVGILSPDGDGVTQVHLKESTTVLQRWQRDYPTTSDELTGFTSVLLDSPSEGSHTYSFSIQHSGSGVDLLAGAEYPCQLIVEDVGSAL